MFSTKHIKHIQSINKKDINFDFRPVELITLVEVNDEC